MLLGTEQISRTTAAVTIRIGLGGGGGGVYSTYRLHCSSFFGGLYLNSDPLR